MPQSRFGFCCNQGALKHWKSDDTKHKCHEEIINLSLKKILNLEYIQTGQNVEEKLKKVERKLANI